MSEFAHLGLMEGLRQAVQSAMPDDLYETHDAGTLYLADSIAGQASARSAGMGLISGALQGMGVEAQNQSRREAMARQIAQTVAGIAGGMVGFDDEHVVHAGDDRAPSGPFKSGEMPTQDLSMLGGASGGMGVASSGAMFDAHGNPIPEQQSVGSSQRPVTGIPGRLDPHTGAWIEGGDPLRDALANPFDAVGGEQTAVGGTDGDIGSALKGFQDQNAQYGAQMDRAMGDWNQAFGARPSIPSLPGLNRPNTLQSAFATAGALLFPQFSMDAAASPFKAQLEWRDKSYQLALQNYAMQNENWQQDLQHREKIIGIIAGQQNHNLAVQQHLLQLQERADYGHEKQLGAAWQAYMAHPEQAMAGARHYNSLLRPEERDLAIPMADAKNAQKIKNTAIAQSAFAKVIATQSKYGVVDDAALGRLKRVRMQMAKQYGLVDDGGPDADQEASVLGDIPTGKSYREKAMELAIAKMQEAAAYHGKQLDFQKSKWAQQLAMDRAALDESIWKNQKWAEHMQTADAQGDERIQLIRDGYALRRELADQQGKVATQVQAKVREIDLKIAGARSKVDSLSAQKNPNAKAVATAQAELADLQGQKDAAAILLQPTIPVGFFGEGGQMPNPSYVGNPAPTQQQQPAAGGGLTQALQAAYGYVPKVTISGGAAADLYNKAADAIQAEPRAKGAILKRLEAMLRGERK